MTELKESEEFAIGLIIFGIAIARDGDAKRVTDWIEPSMFTEPIVNQGMKSLLGRSRIGVSRFLQLAAGIEIVPGELAVDAVLRTFIDIVEARADRDKVLAMRQRAKEAELMAERTKNAGKDAVQ